MEMKNAFYRAAVAWQQQHRGGAIQQSPAVTKAVAAGCLCSYINIMSWTCFCNNKKMKLLTFRGWSEEMRGESRLTALARWSAAEMPALRRVRRAAHQQSSGCCVAISVPHSDPTHRSARSVFAAVLSVCERLAFIQLNQCSVSYLK